MGRLFENVRCAWCREFFSRVRGSPRDLCAKCEKRDVPPPKEGE